MQEIKAEPGSALQEYIYAINACYPEEIVRFITALKTFIQRKIKDFTSMYYSVIT